MNCYKLFCFYFIVQFDIGKWCKPEKTHRACLGHQHKNLSIEPRNIKNVAKMEKMLRMKFFLANSTNNTSNTLPNTTFLRIVPPAVEKKKIIKRKNKTNKTNKTNNKTK